MFHHAYKDFVDLLHSFSAAHTPPQIHRQPVCWTKSGKLECIAQPYRERQRPMLDTSGPFLIHPKHHCCKSVKPSNTTFKTEKKKPKRKINIRLGHDSDTWEKCGAGNFKIKQEADQESLLDFKECAWHTEAYTCVCVCVCRLVNHQGDNLDSRWKTCC